MILLIKKKGDYYRRFEIDIWGLSYTDNKATEELYRKSWYIIFFLKIFKARMELRWKRMRRYIYRIDIIDIRKKKKKWNKRWLSLRLTRLYFLTLQDYQFRQYFRKASKLSGNLETNYCHLLECRTLTLFYRTNFLPDLFLTLRFVKGNRLYINTKNISYVNARIPVGSFITPRFYWRGWLKYHLKQRLRMKAILFNIPRFLFISFKFCFICLLRKPKKKDLVYPISIDIQRISGYY